MQTGPPLRPLRPAHSALPLRHPITSLCRALASVISVGGAESPGRDCRETRPPGTRLQSARRLAAPSPWCSVAMSGRYRYGARGMLLLCGVAVPQRKPWTSWSRHGEIRDISGSGGASSFPLQDADTSVYPRAGCWASRQVGPAEPTDARRDWTSSSNTFAPAGIALCRRGGALFTG